MITRGGESCELQPEWCYILVKDGKKGIFYGYGVYDFISHSLGNEKHGAPGGIDGNTDMEGSNRIMVAFWGVGCEFTYITTS